MMRSRVALRCLPYLPRLVRPKALLILTGLLAITAPAMAEKAASADAFVDSVGVNVHLHHTDTSYSNFAQVEQALKNLHVRHVRDGLIDTTWKDYYNRHNQLGRAGIKAIFITSPNQNDKLLLDYPQRMKDSFEAYEAPNEYDQSGVGNWLTALSSFLGRLDQTVKADSKTLRFPVIGPSLTKADSFAKVRGDCTFDYSNLHNYFAGRNPGTTGWGSNGYGSIAWNLSNVNAACPGKPVITTETGYQTITSLKNSVPESVAAKYVPRVFLEQWLRGIRRTYLYELLDLPSGRSSGDSGFGLLRSNFAPKPAYTALANLVRLLSDPGNSFSPTDLSLQFSGDVTNVHHALFQKRNGSYYLALWVEEPGYDVDGKKAIAVRPRQVVVRINKETAGMLHTFDSSGAVKSKSLEPSATRTLEVTDSVLILQIGSSPPPPVLNSPEIITR